jgi:hypothetical protein
MKIIDGIPHYSSEGTEYADALVAQGERMSEFQPPDREEEPEDDKWERWFAQQEKNGYAVISRDEWRAKLDEAATDGYAEGRKDEREAHAPLRSAAEQILDAGHMNTEGLARLRAAWEAA